MDITTATPVEIDTELARIYGEIAKAEARRDAGWNSVERAAHTYLKKAYRERVTAAEVRDVLVEVVEEGQGKGYTEDQIRRNFAQYEDSIARIETLFVTEVQPLDEEFARRGGWTRAFLVNNSNGHVHRSRRCSTTYPTTQWLWLPEFSGHDETEIVEKAGERACTVCYPSAPVEVLSRPTQIFTPDEIEKQRARVEREAAKAARDAAQIVIENWQEFGRFTGKVFKTERALTNALAGDLSSLVWYGESHPSADEWLWNIEQGRKAVPTWDYDKALAAARKKAVSESKRSGHTFEPKF